MKYLIYAVALCAATTSSVLAESPTRTISVDHKGKQTTVIITRADAQKANTIYSEDESFEQTISPVELGDILKSFQKDRVFNPRASEKDRIQNRWWRGSTNRNIAWLTEGVEPKAGAPAVRSGIARVLIDGIEIRKLETTITPALWEINLISKSGISSKPEKVELTVNDCETPLADANCTMTLDEIWRSISKKLHTREARICMNSQVHIYALRQKQGVTNYLIITNQSHKLSMYFSRAELLAEKDLLTPELQACVIGYEDKQRESL